MKKLPVIQTIIEAYRFTFSHLGTVIGLVWFPLVLATLLKVLPELSGSYADAASDSVTQGTSAIANLAILILTTLLNSVIYVAITRQALGLRQGPAVFHFALSQPEFRVFGATLVLFFVTLSFALAYSLSAVGLVTLVAAQGANGPLASIAAVAILGGALALLYVVVRLSFLVVPVTVVENHINLGRGWILIRDNFWRVLAVLLAVMVPVILIEAIAMEFIIGADVLKALPKTGSTDPKLVQQYINALGIIFRQHLPALMFVELVLAPFNLGLSISASAYAYRALVSNGAPREVTA